MAVLTERLSKLGRNHNNRITKYKKQKTEGNHKISTVYTYQVPVRLPMEYTPLFNSYFTFIEYFPSMLDAACTAGNPMWFVTVELVL